MSATTAPIKIAPFALVCDLIVSVQHVKASGNVPRDFYSLDVIKGLPAELTGAVDDEGGAAIRIYTYVDTLEQGIERIRKTLNRLGITGTLTLVESFTNTPITL